MLVSGIVCCQRYKPENMKGGHTTQQIHRKQQSNEN